MNTCNRYFSFSMINRFLFSSVVFSIFLLIGFETATAQSGSFQQANRLMQQGEVEEALEIYRVLLQRDPANIPVIDRKATALVQLRKYDEAITLLRDFTDRNPGYPNLSVRVGEIYHMAGQRDQAYAWWESLVERNSQNVQVYRLVAESMVNRREHERAAFLYRDARRVMQNDQMFGFDIAQNFTAAGNYEETMREYSHLLTTNPSFINAIQRQIARNDDEFFKDEGIMQFEEASRNLRTGSEQWIAHREMLIWLYNERSLYRRAFATANSLEDRLEGESFPVFSLGLRLANINQFDLAEDAFKRYADNQNHELFVDARRQLSQLYVRQARYLLDNNLDFGNQANELYEQAYDLLSELHESHGQYRAIGEVYTSLVEISLDYLKDSARASEWLNHFENRMRGERDEIIRDYLSGRIYISQHDFARARIALSRANRAAGTGELAERTRYFLSLSDFLNGEFDYARLQMRSLQRQTTSYYANDALRLRSLLQEGIVRDSTTHELTLFSRAKFQHSAGEHAEALETLKHFADYSQTLPLHSEAILLASQIMRTYSPDAAFHLLDTYLTTSNQVTQRERLVWERARLADAIIQSGENPVRAPQNLQQIIAGYNEQNALQTGHERLFGQPGSDLIDYMDTAQLGSLYEDLVIEFPGGFYASAARERIRALQQTSSLLN
ncbi:MAG: hypothetical protein LAT84_04125 [Balneolia bacterium]|nr:hypothetical protein [Balneolia bacterium]